jgi:hypothetical protein
MCVKVWKDSFFSKQAYSDKLKKYMYISEENPLC